MLLNTPLAFPRTQSNHIVATSGARYSPLPEKKASRPGPESLPERDPKRPRIGSSPSHASPPSPAPTPPSPYTSRTTPGPHTPLRTGELDAITRRLRQMNMDEHRRRRQEYAMLTEQEVARRRKTRSSRAQRHERKGDHDLGDFCERVRHIDPETQARKCAALRCTKKLGLTPEDHFVQHNPEPETIWTPTEVVLQGFDDHGDGEEYDDDADAEQRRDTDDNDLGDGNVEVLAVTCPTTYHNPCIDLIANMLAEQRAMKGVAA